MRYLVILVTSCMALLSSQIANAASFDIARPYVLQLIDGKPTEGKLVNARQLTLAAGKHQLVLQWQQERHSGDHQAIERPGRDGDAQRRHP